MLNQNDPAWKLKKINGTTSTIGSYGCLVTAITAILNRAGYTEVTPDSLARESSLFDGSMWTGWSKLPNLYPKLTYAWGERCESYPAPVDKIIRELDAGFFPIIMLDYSPKAGVQTHYLLVLSHDDKGNLFVGDPIDGAEVWLDSRYGALDEKYKILKIDVYHFEKIQESDTIIDNLKNFLFVENRFSEGDIREGMELFRHKESAAREKQELLDALSAKQGKLTEKDLIISELTTQINQKQTHIDTLNAFRDSLAGILMVSNEEGEILGHVTALIEVESKLTAANIKLKDCTEKFEARVKEEVDKRVYSYNYERLKLADENKKLTEKLTKLEAKKDANLKVRDSLIKKLLAIFK